LSIGVRSEMNKMAFQIMGALLLAFAAMFAVGGGLTVARYPPHAIRDVIPLGVTSASLLLLGIGLYRVRKWAALGFSALTVCLAGWSIRDAIHSVPWSWNGIGYWFALVLIIPTILTVRYWRTFEQMPEQTGRLAAP
jgi:hypothetical protein